MFLRARLSPPSLLAPPALPLAGVIFILGMLAGALLSGYLAPAETAQQPIGQMERRSKNATASRLAADVLRVIDGDTFEARVHAWPGIDITTRVRLRGIDAPEMKANCRDEAIKADSSRVALQSILGQGGVMVAHIAPDKYGGRVVADASTRTTADVSSAMLESGHARPYGGGRREGWCG